MKVKKKRNITVVASILILILALSPVNALAQPVGIFSIWDNRHQTLHTGTVLIELTGSGVNVTGTTQAYVLANTIGIRFTLQRQASSGWVNVITSTASTNANDDYVYDSIDYSVSKGFNYRVITTHWTIHNGVREEGTLTSSVIYVN